MSSPVQQVIDDKEKLRDILGKKEYTAYNQPEHSSFWEWLKPLWRKIRSYLPDFHVPQGAGDILTYIVLLILLAIAGYGIYWFSRQIVRNKRVRSAAFLPPGELSRSYDQYWKQAEESRLAGQWREGVRWTFLSLLFYLEARGALRVETWKTNWEYADELAGQEAGLLAAFQESALIFERVWYGKEDAVEAQYALIYGYVAQVISREGDAQREKAE